MNKDQYQQYLIKKYNLPDKTLLQMYARLDAMISFYEIIKSKNTIFKGALNLYIKSNYSREEMTKDLDIALLQQTPIDFASTLESKETLESDLYTFLYKRTERLVISTSGYNGVRVFFEATLPMKSSFHIDIAVEELEVSTWAEEDKDGALSYSIERTLADKFVTIFKRKKENTREKDFIDISAFYKDSNKEELSSLINKLIIAREISADDIIEVNEQWRTYLFMDNTLYSIPISKLMKMVKLP